MDEKNSVNIQSETLNYYSLLFIVNWKLSQQQHWSRIQFAHSNTDWLTLQSWISHIHSEHFNGITIYILILKYFLFFIAKYKV
jgi:hypothetical protein